uniref:(northern house mosquito) hypothetical protein n=1 Tax=Culex pipiens TaxID=7175 RepID=A0A8D8FKX1_CULPI
MLQQSNHEEVLPLKTLGQTRFRLPSDRGLHRMPAVAIAQQQLFRIVVGFTDDLQNQLLQTSTQREIDRIHDRNDRIAGFQSFHAIDPPPGKIFQWFLEDFSVQHLVQVVKHFHVVVVHPKYAPLGNILQLLAKAMRSHVQQRVGAILHNCGAKLLQRGLELVSRVGKSDVELPQEAISAFRDFFDLMEFDGLFLQDWWRGRVVREQFTEVNEVEVGRFLDDGKELHRGGGIRRCSFLDAIDRGQQLGSFAVPRRHHLIHKDLANAELPQECRFRLGKVACTQHRNRVHQLNPGHEAVVNEKETTLVVQPDFHPVVEDSCRTLQLADLQRQRRSQRNEFQPVGALKSDSTGGRSCEAFRYFVDDGRNFGLDFSNDHLRSV